MNALIQVVETHHLLGEIQNGFRRGRSGADNNFILDTILWKNSAKKTKTFFAFLISAKHMTQLIGISCGANCLVLVLVGIF